VAEVAAEPAGKASRDQRLLQDKVGQGRVAQVDKADLAVPVDAEAGVGVAGATEASSMRAP